MEEFKPKTNYTPLPLELSNIVSGNGGSVLIQGSFTSPNYRPSVSGWKIGADGSVEFATGYFRGDISGASGTFNGSITIGTGDNVFKADSNGIYLGNATFASAPFRVTMAGALVATSATITGALTTAAGSTINGTYVDSLAVSKLAAGTITSKAITLAVAAGTGDSKIQAGKTDFTNTESGFILGIDDSDSDKAKFYIGDSANYLNWDGSILTVKGRFDVGGLLITVSAVADLQTALNAVNTAGGGTVYLAAGTYTLTANISAPASVRLKGVSRDDVIIDCNSSYKIQVIGSNSYTTGTVAINDGQTTVVGTGTTWTAGMSLRYILLSGYWYYISEVTDTTHLTISSAYSGANLSGATYAIATPNFAATLSTLTIQNATAEALKIQYAQDVILDDLIIQDSGTGIDCDDSVYVKVNVISTGNGTNLDFNNTWGWKVDYSEFSAASTANGVLMANSGSGTFFDSAVIDNTGDGINLTACSNIAFISNTVTGNGGQGIECVSGCNDLQFIAVFADNNTSDGIKITATSDRNSIVACTISNNGGYGINIAASTCDNNQIIAPAFDSNTSGEVNDAGTNTFISPELTAQFTAGETINGATLPVPVYINNSDSEVYACDANAQGKLKFFGFAISNSTDGNLIKVKTAGVVSGFSGLTVGATYYVSDTAGTISTTPGTLVIPVGKAVSATKLKIIDYPAGAIMAGDNLILSANTERNSSSATYVKVKEVECARYGTYRIKFDLRTPNAGDTAYGRIYKNGVAFGTEQTTTSTTYVTKTEDLTFAEGDLIQLYYHTTAPGSVYTQNFRIYVGGINSLLTITD